MSRLVKIGKRLTKKQMKIFSNPLTDDKGHQKIPSWRNDMKMFQLRAREGTKRVNDERPA